MSGWRAACSRHMFKKSPSDILMILATNITPVHTTRSKNATFVYGSNTTPSVLLGIIESVLGDTTRSVFGDKFDGLYNSADDLKTILKVDINYLF